MFPQAETIAFVAIGVLAALALSPLLGRIASWLLTRDFPKSLAESKVLISDGVAWYQTFPLSVAEQASKALEADQLQAVRDFGNHAIIAVNAPQVVWVVIRRKEGKLPGLIKGLCDPLRTNLDRLSDYVRDQANTSK